MLGALYHGNGRCTFRLWAPFAKSVSARIPKPSDREIPLQPEQKGRWQITVDNIEPGTEYKFRLDEKEEFPDPASNFQIDGVHGPSVVVDHDSFNWSDNNWHGMDLDKMIIYELHVGTFTDQGRFEFIIDRLDDLLDIGINALELMPVAQFPGCRNWGYDGVFPFAVQNSYGGPEGLKKLVDACHTKGMAVILDVVYNHLGPEGNYLSQFAPYFTDKYKTPWGKAINFDDAHSDQVREYFISNALYWFDKFHIDALRLDALHAVYDFSAKPFLKELSERVDDFQTKVNRKCYLIGESDLNDVKLIKEEDAGGYGLDAQWCDDFHHSLHTLLTGEEKGYYSDFGKPEDLVKSINEGFVYSWKYSHFRKRHHGSSSKDITAEKFVVCSQNHDQIGNRMLGDRLASLVSFEALKLAAGAVLFSPYIPLLFMGQEYGQNSPFLYFVSHNDPDLIKAVQKGRKEEFKSFHWKGQVPDPQAQDTFEKSKIKWENRKKGKHKFLLNFYKRLLELRKQTPALAHLSKENLQAKKINDKKIIAVNRRHEKSHIFILMNFEHQDCTFVPQIPEGKWISIIDSSDEKWGGKGVNLPKVIQSNNEITMPAESFAAYQKETPDADAFIHI